MQDRSSTTVRTALLLGLLALVGTTGFVPQPGPPSVAPVAMDRSEETVDPRDPLDCAGPAPEAEAGTPEWHRRDLHNVLCAEQRLTDAASHPVAALPVVAPVFDAYRQPTLHDGTRFRFHETTVTDRYGEQIEVELYRPCAEDTCSDLPGELETHEPPYPAVLVQHGGYQSVKELHWWATQSLAEAGYMTVSLSADHDRDEFFEDSGDVLDWFTATPAAPTNAGEYNPFFDELDAERIGMAGHSGGGATANLHGHTDERIKAVVGWDRSGRYDLPAELTVPSLYLIADHGFTPERHEEPPEPRGYDEGEEDRGDRFQDFRFAREQGIDSMKLVLRAATHLDWVPMVAAASRYGEAVSAYYTIAWFDRYLKGLDDPEMAADAFDRLTTDTFDDSYDRHNLSQGHYDPVQHAQSADLYGGNVPYQLDEQPVADRLSFYYRSKCHLSVPGSPLWAVSEDLRAEGCAPVEPDVAVDCIDCHLEVRAGETGEADLEIRNDGQSPVEIALQAQSPDGWQTSVVPQTLSLDPGESSVVVLEVTPPHHVRDAQLIEVTAWRGGDLLDSEVVAVDVVRGSPGSPGGGSGGPPGGQGR